MVQPGGVSFRHFGDSRARFEAEVSENCADRGLSPYAARDGQIETVSADFAPSTVAVGGPVASIPLPCSQLDRLATQLDGDNA